MSKTIQIALIDDHRMFLDGLREVINSLSATYECHSYASPRAAILEIENGRAFDLIVSDFVMEEMNGIALILALKARQCLVPVLIVSGIDTLPPVEKVLQNGAMGFVPKSAPTEVLAQGISAALRGEVFLPPELWTVMETSPSSSHAVSPQPGSDDTELIGPRQMEVLRLVAEGYSNKRISDVLAISENTVKTHVKQIFRQLNVTRRTACVSKAQALGLLD
jgi:DNA-binding NarL/FixJ family response regulator